MMEITKKKVLCYFTEKILSSLNQVKVGTTYFSFFLQKVAISGHTAEARLQLEALVLRLLGSGVGGVRSSLVGPPLPFLFSFCLMLVYVFDRKNYVKKGFLLQRRTLMHYKMGENRNNAGGNKYSPKIICIYLVEPLIVCLHLIYVLV